MSCASADVFAIDSLRCPPDVETAPSTNSPMSTTEKVVLVAPVVLVVLAVAELQARPALCM